MSEERKALFQLSMRIREMVEKNKSNSEEQWGKCREMVCGAMEQYPNAAEPHNLYGILLEEAGNHTGAMKHFRAAAALDPTYLPARKNLERFGSFERDEKIYYTEEDCIERKEKGFALKKLMFPVFVKKVSSL